MAHYSQSLSASITPTGALTIAAAAGTAVASGGAVATTIASDTEHPIRETIRFAGDIARLGQVGWDGLCGAYDHVDDVVRALSEMIHFHR